MLKTCCKFPVQHFPELVEAEEATVPEVTSEVITLETEATFEATRADLEAVSVDLDLGAPATEVTIPAGESTEADFQVGGSTCTFTFTLDSTFTFMSMI